MKHKDKSQQELDNDKKWDDLFTVVFIGTALILMQKIGQWLY